MKAWNPDVGLAAGPIAFGRVTYSGMGVDCVLFPEAS
jgi:hypothetical protein